MQFQWETVKSWFTPEGSEQWVTEGTIANRTLDMRKHLAGFPIFNALKPHLVPLLCFPLWLNNQNSHWRVLHFTEEETKAHWDLGSCPRKSRRETTELDSIYRLGSPDKFTSAIWGLHDLPILGPRFLLALVSGIHSCFPFHVKPSIHT